ncbi:alpha/beta hydrolase family protein [Celeribacter sp.]|uniref:alpha/beta hydrolase family protein n=1 Tax=Celeribacter sp. TaxID=1890673 RepID=UPI003A8EC5D3
MSHLKMIAKSTTFAAVLCLSGWVAYDVMRPPYDGTAGITYGSAYAPIRDTDVDFHIWYPAAPGGKSITVGGNGVFYGTPAGRDAPRQNGQFPMIVISHGSGGNAGQFGWIASELAQAGYVVVLPNHPGTTTGNASAEAAVRVWERPADVSAVLDEITANAGAYPYIDTDRISILGFSAGGYTAMATSGARVDPDALQGFCDDSDHDMSDCAFLAHFGVDLHAIDMSPAAQDLRDPRIKTAVIVDPGIIETLTVESLEQIDIPMLIINLGDEDKIPVGIYARSAADAIPNATYAIVNDATHFSFLARCKPKGAQILIDEGELDPLCDDAGGRVRSDIHDELTRQIITYLQEHL